MKRTLQSSHAERENQENVIDGSPIECSRDCKRRMNANMPPHTKLDAIAKQTMHGRKRLFEEGRSIRWDEMDSFES